VKAAKSRQIVPNDFRHCRDLGEGRESGDPQADRADAAGHHAVLVDAALGIIECLQFSPAFLAECPQRIDSGATHQIA
jgi:hypothetical protein